MSPLNQYLLLVHWPIQFLPPIVKGFCGYVLFSVWMGDFYLLIILLLVQSDAGILEHNGKFLEQEIKIKTVMINEGY